MSRTVNFSSTIDFFRINEDEVGNAIRYTISDKQNVQPRMHHFTDDHVRPARERFQDEFHPRQTPDDHAHVLAQQPAHIQDLALTLHQQGVFDPRAQERYIKVLTWYIHGRNGRACRLPRLVRLPEDFTTWNEILTSAWRESLEPHEAVRFFTVEPEPPIAEWEEHDAQILLVQAPQHFERAVLFTSLYHAREQIAIQRIARFHPSDIRLADCIENAEVPMQVRHRLIHCYYGWRPILDIPHPAIDINDGAAIVLHVRPEPDSPCQQQQYPFDFLWEEDAYVPQHAIRHETRPRSRSPRRHQHGDDDETSLMARQPRQIPRDEEYGDEETESSASASTYDSNEPSDFFHIFQLQAPMYAARVRMDSWPLAYSQIRHVLGLDRHEIQYIHIASFRPADLYASGTLVAVVQRAHDLLPGDHRRIVLIDIVFHEHEAALTTTHRYATLVRKDLTRRILLEELKLQEFCKQVKQQRIVQVNGKHIPLSSHTLFEVQHADYVRIDLPPHPKRTLPSRAIARCLRDGIQISEGQRQYDNGETDFEWETVQIEREDDQEDVQMLQVQWDRRLTAEQVAHTQRPDPMPTQLNLDSLIPAPQQSCIEFAAVQWLGIELNNLSLDLIVEWPEDLQLQEVTIDHLNTLGDLMSQKPNAIHFYVDGSKIGQQVGAGIACFVDYATHTALAGVMSKSVQLATHAFIGEHAAMMWALLWAVQLSEWVFNTFATYDIEFSFNFDAMNTGHQTAGLWRTLAHKPWKTALRSLAQLLETRHTQSKLKWNHVKAHTQHPRNELVDQLAKFAAHHPDRVGGCEAWWHWITEERYQTALSWLWYYEHLQKKPYDAPLLEGTLLTAQCAHVRTTADAPSPSPDEGAMSEDDEVTAFDFVIATANILTLANEDQQGRITPTKQMLLMKQFDEAGCHVIGLEETRHKRIINPNNDLYHIVGHPADAKGHDGVQLWFSKTKPMYEDGPCISMKHLRVVSSTPTLLIVKLDMPRWKCLFVTGRAPHSGRANHENLQFWQHVSKHIRSYANNMPIFFAGDTNGHIGDQETAAVGSHFASIENSPGSFFHNWLLEHDLWVPSTFTATHISETNATFTSPDGQHATRIDYVAIPQHITYAKVQSWVDDTIDLGGARIDHQAAMCRCTFTTLEKKIPYQFRTKQLKPSRQAIAAQLRDPSSADFLHKALSNSEWHVDPHQSADHLAECTQKALNDLIPRTQRWRRKTHVDAATWTLVEEKKQLFRQLKSMKKVRSNTILATVLKSWRSLKTSSTQMQPQSCHHSITEWMKMIDHAIAITTSQLKAKAKMTTAAIRKADTAYYLHLAQQAGDKYSHEGLTAVWKQIKCVLPRHRMKQTQAKQDFGDELLQHFALLEAGTVGTHASSIQQCVERNNSDLQEAPRHRHLDLADLPTLVEVEDLCLKQRPNRAPGLDAVPPEVCRFAAKAIAPFLHNVILKSFIWGLEPHRYKGGQLCAIWKQKQSCRDPSAYRGILLAEVYGKVLHSWARQRLLPTLVHRRAPGQIGGLPSQQTTTAIQLIKLHGRQGRHKKLTTVIFVDLKAAFHHMLREFVFAVKKPLSQSELQTFLDPTDFNIAQIAADLQEACQDRPQDVPEALRLFLHDIHCSTWFKLDPDRDQTVTTTRGTRPGSPLADLGFNLLMARIMHQLGAGLQQLPLYARGCDLLGTTVPPISWVDDLALPLTAEKPDQMIPLIQQATALLHDTFKAHGMTMNFEQGKSEAVVMYRGPGANACRTALFDTGAAPCIVTTTDTHVLTLKVVATYRHLGARFSMNADTEMEIQTRMSMARQAYQELKRPLFHNKYIPCKGRLQLYDSLVVARLLYACSTWTDVSTAQLRQLEAVLIDHYRQISNIGYWSESNMTDEELRHHLEVPTFRVIWARHRLIYLQHISQHAAAYHRQLLLAEYRQGRGWLCEVLTDLQWMGALVELPFDIATAEVDWPTLWEVLQEYRPWKNLVKRACRKHLIQNRIARDVAHYHTVILEELEAAGFHTWQGNVPEAEDLTCSRYRCNQCDMTFATAHARGSHAYQVHGTLSDERPYVQSTVCPGCLKDHHTTWRVQQHLKYRQNGCWDRIHGARQPAEPCTIKLPKHLQHVQRLPAVRRHFGPIRPTSTQRQRISLRQRITALQHAGKDEFAWWHPESDPALVDRAFAAFGTGLATWCMQDSPTSIDFQNVMFQQIFRLDVPDLLGGRLFIHWIETRFYDEWPEDLEPNLIDILEEAYMLMLEDIPAWSKRCAMKELTNLWMNLPPDEPDLPPRQLPQTSRPRHRLHDIPCPFARMGHEEGLRRQWKLLGAPRRPPPSKRGPYYIVHLYSGRRRPNDFHAAVYGMLHRFRHLDIRVLSIDTAVDPTLNVHDEKLWRFLTGIAREGRVLGLLQGPPCETWTAARHQQQVDSEGNDRRGPRPVRSAQDPWGLAMMSCSELEQVFVGNILLLKGLVLACLVTFTGGATFLEHPSMPFQEEYASIWRLGLTCMLHRPPHGPFRRVSAEQWRYGSCGVKPTMFLYSNSNLPQALAECAIPGATRPTQHLIGQNPDGTFRTAQAKEYPAQLNQAFAQAIFRAMQSWHMAPNEADAESYGAELAKVAACTEHNDMCPDYQPR